MTGQAASLVGRTVRESSAARQAAVEIALVLAVLLFHLWTDSREVFPRAARTATTIAIVAVVAGLLWRDRCEWRSWGLLPDRPAAGLASLGAATAVAVTALAAVGSWLGTFGNARDVGHWLGQVWYLEAGQQILLQLVLAPRLRVILGGPSVIVSAAAAALFALTHLPNPLLVPLTALAGFAWCEWFRHYRNFAAVWASHLILGWTTLVSLDGELLRRMRVGIAYCFYQG